MLRKQKTDSLNVTSEAGNRPARRSFPGTLAPNHLQLEDAADSTRRRKKSSERRKVSRVHLGRLQLLAEDSIEDEVSSWKRKLSFVTSIILRCVGSVAKAVKVSSSLRS